MSTDTQNLKWASVRKIRYYSQIKDFLAYVIASDGKEFDNLSIKNIIENIRIPKGKMKTKFLQTKFSKAISGHGVKTDSFLASIKDFISFAKNTGLLKVNNNVNSLN